MTLVLSREPPPGCGDDHVTAINLARQLRHPVDPSEVTTAREKVEAKYAAAKDVQIQHYIGGPCGPESISHCVVAGGNTCGWTVLTSLDDAIELAHMRSYARRAAQGDVLLTRRYAHGPPLLLTTGTRAARRRETCGEGRR